MIEVFLLGGCIDLTRNSQKNFGSLRASPLYITGPPKDPKSSYFEVPVYTRGGGPQTPKIFWEFLIKSIDPPNKDTSINFTPSLILEAQYVLVSFPLHTIV